MSDKNAIRVLKSNNNREIYMEKITELLRNIKYGSITLIVQDGVVIQIETNEKIRLK